MALVMALLPAENENQQLTDLPQVDFVLTVGTNNITENFAYWKLGPLFLSWFNVCFHLECANVLYDFYSEVRSLHIHYYSRFFLSVKVYCVYMIYKINSCFYIWNLFRVFNSTSHSLAALIRELSSWGEEKCHLNARPSIILYVLPT